MEQPLEQRVIWPSMAGMPAGVPALRDVAFLPSSPWPPREAGQGTPQRHLRATGWLCCDRARAENHVVGKQTWKQVGTLSWWVWQASLRGMGWPRDCSRQMLAPEEGTWTRGLFAAEKAASPLPEGRHCLAQSVMVSMWHKRKVVRSETLKWGQILGIPF